MVKNTINVKVVALIAWRKIINILINILLCPQYFHNILTMNPM